MSRARRWRPWLLLLALVLLLTFFWSRSPATSSTAPPLATPPTPALRGGQGTPVDPTERMALGGHDGVARAGEGGATVGAPLTPTIGADGIARPTVQILEPAPDTLVTGSVWVRWESAAAAPIESAEIHVNGRQIVRLVDGRQEKKLDMRYFEGGQHILEVTVYDANRRKGSDTVTVRVRNPSFALQRLTRRTTTTRNGEELVVELSTNGSSFVPRADLGPIDSAFDEQAIEWSDLGGGRWLMRYRLSRQNERPDGSYWMAVTLEDREEPSISDSEMVRIELSNYARGDSLREAIEVPCAVYRPDIVPPAARELPRLLSVAGPAEGRVGEPLRLVLGWDGSPGREGRFLRLSVDGMSGHYVLHGKCGLEDVFELVPRAVGDQPLRLAIWPSEGLPVVHRLRVVEAP